MIKKTPAELGDKTREEREKGRGKRGKAKEKDFQNHVEISFF